MEQNSEPIKVFLLNPLHANVKKLKSLPSYSINSQHTIAGWRVNDLQMHFNVTFLMPSLPMQNLFEFHYLFNEHCPALKAIQNRIRPATW